MRRTSLVAGIVVAAALASPVVAAAPVHFKIDISDPQLEADATAQATKDCGFPVSFEGRGHINVLVFDPPRGRSRNVEIDTYAMHETWSANGKSVVVNVDAGPDLYRFDRTTGLLTVAITGRAITGTGVIGRVVIDENDNVLFVAGNDRGDFVTQLCAALAP